MLLAQSLGEYGSLGGGIARIATTFESGAQWVTSSLHEHPVVWIAAVAVMAGAWLFRRR
jgi:uncharacterized protein (TIGR03382 family)